MSLFIIIVVEDNEQYQYEYGNYSHAEEHYRTENTATIFEYVNGHYYFIKAKIKQYRQGRSELNGRENR